MSRAGVRHSLNPFPPGMRVGYLRRPDVIIVKNPAGQVAGARRCRSRGQAGTTDNSLRLVEVKFPGDAVGKSPRGSLS